MNRAGIIGRGPVPQGLRRAALAARIPLPSLETITVVAFIAATLVARERVRDERAIVTEGWSSDEWDALRRIDAADARGETGTRADNAAALAAMGGRS